MQMQMQRAPVPYHKRVERFQRASTIKLVDIEGYRYTVLGSTGKLYTISIGEKFSCNCIDCKRTGGYCKHIYFIFTNVYRFTPDLNKTYSMDELKRFHDGFIELKTNKKARNEFEDCPICFECNTGNCYTCDVCENGFHSSCIKTMFQFSNKCPMCRSVLCYGL